MNLFVWITGGSILGAALIALCNYALKNYIKNITKNHFDKNIENHKQELTKELKEVEVNYQRKMEDFSLYTQKRHGVYANLYKHLNEAVNKMLYATSSLRQYPLPQAPQPDFEDVKKILLDEDFDNEDINKVIRKW